MIIINDNKCDFCGCCVGVCPENCIELYEAKIKIIHEICTDCGKCVWVCPFGVFELQVSKKKKNKTLE